MLLTLVLASLLASDWGYYGGDAGGTHFSARKQVNSSNVNRLQKAWEYHTRALPPDSKLNDRAAFEATPILIGGVLYLSTPINQIIALDAATGTERWKYDPQVEQKRSYSEVASRGVAFWADPDAKSDVPCATRVFEGTIDARLIAVDAKTGKVCMDFGESGQVDLSKDVGRHGRGAYQVTSAPTVARNLVITGSSIGDNRMFDVERGVVRAFDARTGALKWSWDPIPWDPAKARQTGAANAWSTISFDAERDLIFVPTGSAAPDFYGGMRLGNDEYADSVTALRASTGQVVWSYQVVHHDLWDYDVAAQPALITFKGRPAVAVATKMGLLFVLDRDTGKPLHDVKEQPVPKSDVEGEEASPTQPIPSWEPLVPQGLKPEQVQAGWCAAQVAKLRNDGMYTPPSLKGTLVSPGNAGGVNWGGIAVDTAHQLVFADTNRLAGAVRLIPRDQFVSERVKANENRFTGEFGAQLGTPYAMYREWLISPEHTLCNPTPWGALVAFDLNTGKVKWQAPIGTMVPGKNTGTPNLGGPMVTAGGLVFTAAATDSVLRAFDEKTGAEVWKSDLPAGAQATPMSYTLSGRQYIVICAGGHGKMGSKMGDSVVAFTLKNR